MKKVLTMTLIALVAAGGGVVAGLYLGVNAMERAYGSPAAHSVQRLGLSAATLTSGTGVSRSPEQIAKTDAYFANLNSLVVASLYCQMDPALQAGAKEAAKRLSGAEPIIRSRHEGGNLARQYLLAAPLGQRGCKPFHDPTTLVVLDDQA